MIITAPHFVNDNRYVIVHDATWTYTVDLAHQRLQGKVQGVPIAISSDEMHLVVCQGDMSADNPLFQAIHLETQSTIDIQQVLLADHNAHYFRKFDVRSGATTSVIIGEIANPAQLTSYSFERVIYNVEVGDDVYWLLSSSLFAVRASIEYDAEDYGAVYFLDATTGDKTSYPMKLHKPFNLNYTATATQFTLVRDNYISFASIDLTDTSGGSNPIAPINRDSQIIDALKHPSQENRVLVGEPHR